MKTRNTSMIYRGFTVKFADQVEVAKFVDGEIVLRSGFEPMTRSSKVEEKGIAVAALLLGFGLTLAAKKVFSTPADQDHEACYEALYLLEDYDYKPWYRIARNYIIHLQDSFWQDAESQLELLEEAGSKMDERELEDWRKAPLEDWPLEDPEHSPEELLNNPWNVQ